MVGGPQADQRTDLKDVVYRKKIGYIGGTSLRN